MLENRDQGARIVEWVHMLRILGVVKKVHSDLAKVLNNLKAKDLIEWKSYKDPSGFDDSNDHNLQNRILRMVPINDCFYKTRNSYEFIVLLDLNEIIMPLMEEDRNWQDILTRSDSVGVVSTNVNFISEIIVLCRCS